MIQFVLARAKSGDVMIVRQCDIEQCVERDGKYPIVVLPAFESDILGAACIRGRFTKSEVELMQNLALPLYPENWQENTEGDEWKQS